jgi:hypothetical protein
VFTKLVKYMMVLQQWTDGSGARKRYYNSHLQLSNLFLEFSNETRWRLPDIAISILILLIPGTTLLYCRGESPFCADGLVSFSAVDGVEPQPETNRDSADQIAPMHWFVNKMDRQGSDFWWFASKKHAKIKCCCNHFTIGEENDFKGAAWI